MKITNKILSALLVLCMVISLFPGVSFVAQAADEVTPVQAADMSDWVATKFPDLAEKKLAINDVEDFKQFQLALAKWGKTFEGYTIYLTADIDMNPDWDSAVSLAWDGKALTEDSVQTTTGPADTTTHMPGIDTTNNTSKAKQFGGIFEGQGHTISGLYLSLNAGNAASLFGQVIGSAEVKDLAVLRSYFANGGSVTSTEGKPLAGIFTNVPSGTTAKISGCYVDIDLYEKSTSTKNAQARLGGLVGYCAGTLTIEDTIYAGSMSFNKAVNGTYRLDNAGGFIGRVNGTSESPANVTVKNSVFAGNIWSPYQRAAGFIGRSEGYANVTMANCLTLGRFMGSDNIATMIASVLVQGSSVVQNVTLNDCYFRASDSARIAYPAGTHNGNCSLKINVNGVEKYTLGMTSTATTGYCDETAKISAANFTGLKAKTTLNNTAIGGNTGTLADVFVPTLGIVFPKNLYKNFASIANKGLAVYDDAAIGDLLYTVNFNGDNVFKPGNIVLSSKMTYEALDNNTLRVYGNTYVEGNIGAMWGGNIGAYMATADAYYTMTYQVWVDSTDIDPENGDIHGGTDSWISVGGVRHTTTEKENVYGLRLMPWRDMVQFNNRTGAIGQAKPVPNDALLEVTTDAEGRSFYTIRVTYDGPNGIATGYALLKGCSGTEASHWIKLTDAAYTTGDDAELMFTIATGNTKVDSIIKNVKYYKGDIVGYNYYPKFAEGTVLTDVGNGNYQASHTGVAAADVNAFINKLTAEGWARYSNKVVEAGNTIFATLVKDGYMVHVTYFGDLNGRLHLTYGPASTLLPQVTAAAANDTVTPSVSIIERTDNVLCMVVQLADGTFVVIDGGRGDSNENKTQEELYLKPGATAATISRDYKKDIETLLSFMQSKTTGKPQVIWMITHGHTDHVGLADMMMEENTDDFDLLSVVYNFPSYENIGLNPEKDKVDAMYGYLNGFITAANKYFPNASHHVYHTGQVWQLPGVEIEFLFTHEDMLPGTMPSGNHTSSIWRFNFSSGESLMITGDNEQECNQQVTAVFGSYLKSDMLQVIHHGTDGATLNFYKAVDPSICFWPALDCMFENDQRLLGTWGTGGLIPVNVGLYYYNYWLRNEGNRTHYTTSATHTVEIGGHTHTPGTAVKENEKAPTCGKPGSYDSVVYCTECGKEISRETVSVPATGKHSWNDGVITTKPTSTTDGVKTYTCSVCGGTKTETIGKFTAGVINPKSVTLSLDDLIFLNVYSEYTGGTLSQAYIEAHGGLLYWNEAVYPGDDKVSILDANAVVVHGLSLNASNGRYLGTTEGIALKNLGDTLKICSYVELPDGTIMYSRVIEYSGRKYAESRIKNIDGTANPSAKLVAERDVCISMLNAVYEAQKFFKHNLENPANASLSANRQVVNYSADMITAPIAIDRDLTRDKTVFSSRGASLALEGKIELNYSFTIPAQHMSTAKDTGMLYWSREDYERATVLDASSATYTGELEATTTANKYSAMYPKAFATKEYEDTVYACAYLIDADGNYHYSGIIAYNVEAYAKSKINGNSAEADLCKALVVYGEAAKAYFAL